jgi:H+/Cl- antiporter ClcA
MEIGMIIRNAIVLCMLSTALIYWLGDFNTYAHIGSLEFVTARPAPVLRLAYSLGLGLVCGIVGAVAFRAAGRNEFLLLIALPVVYTVVFYGFADLNLYVVGHGPDGQDWVKDKYEWGLTRLQMCAVLGCVAGVVALFLLYFFGGTKQPQPSDRDSASTG